ncbi:MAG TPA: RluA family pseudouridine synthase [Parvibaculum sp.]|jgi:23S rRNA pseudouridine1911/1915/1917 synthase
MTSSSEEETGGQHYAVTVEPEAAGTRLDKYLTEALGSKTGDEPLSRARLKSLLDEGRVARLEKGAAKILIDASYRVKEGEEFTVDVPAPVDARPQAQAIPLEIVYEDKELIVVMKPAGLVVHPAAGNQDMTLVNALLAHCGATLSGIGGERRPGIVHRLDKDTSGLMVVAKTDRAHRALSEQFAAHGRDGKLTRAYTAFVWGKPLPKVGKVEANIDRSTHNRSKMAVAKRGGREAITHYKVKESYGEPPVVSVVECRLETGRTHQIRVHMTSIGHPVLGDQTYGGSQKTRKVKLSPETQAALERLGRQALHAHHLGFEHPVTLEPLAFDAPLPADMQALLDALENE